MPNVDDAGGAIRDRDREREKLEEANLDERDREAIQRFVRHRRVHGTDKTGDYKPTTERDDLNRLRLSAERADTPLVEMGLEEINRLIDLLTTEAPPKDENGKTWRSKYYEGIPPGTNGYGWGITTGIDAYKRVYRPFFRWLHQHDDYGEYSWWERVKTGREDFPEPRERNFPEEEDYEAMFEAARGNPRNQALLSFYHDSAVRATLGAQLRVGDIQLSTRGDERATFTPNPNGERQKNVEIKPYPLYDCVADLRVWINKHHPHPVDEAPLWPKQNFDKENPKEGALSPRRIREIMHSLAEEAGIASDVETKPHAWRHAAIGRWKERGYGLTEVQRRTAWGEHSAADLWAEYGDPDHREVDDNIDRLEGRTPPDTGDDEEDSATPDRYTCGNCEAGGITSPHCPECGAPVTPEARQQDMDSMGAGSLLDQLAEEIGQEAGLDPEQIEDRKERMVKGMIDGAMEGTRGVPAEEFEAAQDDE